MICSDFGKDLALSQLPTTICVVEDDPGTRELLIEIFTEEGFTVSSAKSGDQAVKLVQEMRPDLILMDLRMPIMDGFEAAEAIKTNPATGRIPIIILSALKDLTDATSGPYFDDVVAKPFDVDGLIARVKSHICTGKRLASLNDSAT